MTSFYTRLDVDRRFPGFDTDNPRTPFRSDLPVRYMVATRQTGDEG